MSFPIVALGDAVTFLDHLRKPITTKDRVSGPVPYYGANGQQDSVAGYIFDEPLVLLAEDGGFFQQPNKGVAYRICGPSWVNNHAHVLRPRENVDIGYLRRVLENYRLAPFVSGSTRGKLTKENALLIPIPLPHLSEQRRIAAILDHADELRTKRRRALALLDELMISSFVDRFGDVTSNSHGFELSDFGDLGQLDRGVSRARPRNSAELLGGIHPLIQTGDVANSDGYVRMYSQTYSELGLAQSKMWPAGTLAITIAANIAKTGILTFAACFPDSLVGFTPDPMKTNVEFIRFWLSFLQPTLEAQAPASAQRNINLAILRALPVPVPTLSAQEDFAKFVRKAQSVKESAEAHISKLDELFACLQHRAFNGEL